MRHQREVGTGYFDDIAQVVAEGKSSTNALHGSTEREQFHAVPGAAADRSRERETAVAH